MVDFTKCLQPKQVAAVLGMSEHGLRNWANKRIGPNFYRRGIRYYYDPEDVRQYIEGCKVTTRGM